MIQQLQTFLDGIKPGLFSAVVCTLLSLVTGGLVYGSRKLIPGFWLYLEHENAVLSKLLQSLPATIIGTGGALLFELPAELGAGAGFGAIVGHHIMKALKKVPYQGELGGRGSVPPSATSILFAVLLFVGCTPVFAGCAGAAQALQTIKTISDVARDLCMVTGVEKTGLDPKAVRDKFCETEEQLRPWIGLAREAQQTGAMQTGMSGK